MLIFIFILFFIVSIGLYILYKKKYITFYKNKDKTKNTNLCGKVTEDFLDEFAILSSETIDKEFHFEEFFIDKNIILIEDSAFINCKNLCSIRVDPNNINYVSKSGVLFSKDMKDIICYPPAKKSCTYFIPQGVENIRPHTFFNNDNLKYIIIPTTLNQIGENSFVNCHNLNQVAIPKNIDNIHPRAFNLCPRLTIKCYKDSAAESFCKKFFIPLDYLD